MKGKKIRRGENYSIGTGQCTTNNFQLADFNDGNKLSKNVNGAFVNKLLYGVRTLTLKKYRNKQKNYAEKF